MSSAEGQQRFARHLIGRDVLPAGELMFSIYGQLPGRAHKGCPFQATRLGIAREPVSITGRQAPVHPEVVGGG